jgi:acylphosphatase
MPEKTRQQVHAVVHGRVQGVNFRAYTIRQAIELGLTGWVRNVINGTVETVAEGERESLDSFLAFLSVGSPSSVVTQVDVEWQTATGEFADFRVRYDSW